MSWLNCMCDMKYMFIVCVRIYYACMYLVLVLQHGGSGVENGKYSF